MKQQTTEHHDEFTDQLN